MWRECNGHVIEERMGTGDNISQLLGGGVERGGLINTGERRLLYSNGSLGNVNNNSQIDKQTRGFVYIFPQRLYMYGQVPTIYLSYRKKFENAPFYTSHSIRFTFFFLFRELNFNLYYFIIYFHFSLYSTPPHPLSPSF
jgi:hypothetical protein